MLHAGLGALSHACGPIYPHQTSLAPCLTVGPASPCAWNVCVASKASLVASNSDKDEQKVVGALEAVSIVPGREASPLPTSAPRCAGQGGRRAPGAHGGLAVSSTLLALEQANPAAMVAL